MENHQKPKREEEKEVSFQWFIITLLVHWKWFVLSVFVFLCGGYLYLRYSTPIYPIATSIVLRDNQKGGLHDSELSTLESVGLVSPRSSVENEMEILRSRNLIENAVIEQGIFIRHIVRGRFKDTELYTTGNTKYYPSLPIKIYTDKSVVSSLRGVIFMTASLKGDSIVNIKGNYWGELFEEDFSSLPAVIRTPVGELMVLAGEIPLRKEYPIEIQVIPPLYVAQSYAAKLNISLAQEKTSIVRLSLNETHRKRGEDFLATLIELYNRDSMEETNKGIKKALQFLEERLTNLNEELGVAERVMEQYKQDNRISSIEEEASLRFTETNDYEKQYIQNQTDTELLSFLEKEIDSNSEQLLPSLALSGNAGLASMVDSYNTAILEKERLSAYTSGANPRILKLEEEISILKNNIKSGIGASKLAIQVKKKELDNLNLFSGSSFDQLPRIEREFTEILRQQATKANLYMTLLQQKERVSLSLAVFTPFARVLESPLSSSVPVSPKRMMIYVICLGIGFVVPFIIMGIRELINYKLSDEGEVRRFSQVPVIVSLPYVRTREPLVVSPHATSSIAERFRLLRTNLQFVLGIDSGKKSILVTSTISGEGKTFVAINLARTFSLKYKTILVGLDIRRPKIGNYLGLPKEVGLISYLTGEEKDADKLISKNVKGTNLDVLMSGIIPPNPNELLIEKTLDELFVYLKSRYDYIVIDSSPIGSVSDAFLLNRVADASLFVVRRNFSPKSALTLLNYIDDDRRLNNINLVLNGFNEDKAGR
ncbi:MAG: polysaccharide biosynthesis tyrosine autokinase, partial [Dysgonamonadaceae bacterium]|nr:polysaccharide biosynthesis tyrosine autokinase [Dysgonamonadaceae bacterium]